MTNNQGPQLQNWSEPPVKSFNWGAAGLPQPWSLYHRQWAWFALSLFMPLIASIVLGFLGNKIAWESGVWRDAEEFIRSNERWRLAGLVTVVMMSVLMLMIGIFYAVVLGAVMKTLLSNPNALGGITGPGGLGGLL
jgi:hypothetical protein